MFETSVRQKAAASGLAITSLVSRSMGGQSVSVDMVAAGSNGQVIGFINSVEQQPPAARMAQWRIASADGNQGNLRLAATIMAVWSAGQ